MQFTFEGLQKAIKKFNESKNSDDNAFIDYVISSANALTLIQLVLKEERDNDVTLLAKNNIIVNLVTSMEVFFKQLISHNDWNEDNYDHLLKEKITLGESFNAFKGVEITKQFLIGHFRSFQNLESISPVFGTLLSIDPTKFLKTMEEYKSEYRSDTDILKRSLLEQQPEWRKIIIELFDVRHNFIHEGIVAELSEKDVLKYFGTVIQVVVCFDSFIQDHLKKPNVGGTTKKQETIL